MLVQGGCHCGFVTYEADADPERTFICHCTDCQTLSGSAFRTVVPVPDSGFRLGSGLPAIYVKIADSGAAREQAFCPRCGSAIYATAPGPGPKVYNVRVGTIRQRHQFAPSRQFWQRSQQSWLADIPSLPGSDRQ